MMSKTVRNSLIAGTVVLSIFAAVCAKSCYAAREEGARYETLIAAAEAQLKQKDEAFAQTLAEVTGNSALSSLSPAKVQRIARHWKPLHGVEHLADGTHPTQDLQKSLRKAQDASVKVRITVANLQRQYKAQMSSPWSGFWLRLNGFPKRPLSAEPAR